MRGTGRREGGEPGRAARAFDFLAGFDWIQIAALTFLIALGLVFIRSIGIQAGAPQFFVRQLRWIAAGAAGWLAASQIDCRRVGFKLLAVLFYFVSLGLLILVLKAGVTVYGATRWLDVPVLGLSQYLYL